jgi:hypothetical protein
MKATACAILSGALIFAASSYPFAQDASKGAALLGEARRALGGEEKLRAIKTLDVRGDFKRSAGQTTIEGELQVRLEMPDKLRRDEDLSLPGGGPAVIRTEVLNGSTVWEDISGGGGAFIGRFGRGDRAVGGGGGGAARDGTGAGRAAIDPAQLEQAQRRARQTELSRFMLAWLLNVEGNATWVATAESPEGKADVIEITPANAPVTRLFLDQTTHMPLMITWQGIAPQLVVAGRGRGGRGGQRAGGAEPGDPGARRGGGAREQATLQMTLGNYKAVNGVKLPHLITRGVNDMTIEEWTIDSYRLNPTFKADVFAK